MKAYNFFLDIDGTLIPEGKKIISDENLAAIKRARSFGCKFFINTGRPYSDIDSDTFKKEYFDGICSSGDYIVYKGTPIYSAFLPNDDAKALLKALMSMDKKLNFNIGGLRNRYYIGEKMPHYSDKVYLPIQKVDELETIFDGDSLQKYSIFLSDSLKGEVKRVLERYFGTIKHPSFTEGFLRGHDKAFLIKKAEELLSLPHETTVAIGDSHNDVDMMRYAAVSVAMGNAPDEVKKLCSFVTDTTENNGVARAIEKLING